MDELACPIRIHIFVCLPLLSFSLYYTIRKLQVDVVVFLTTPAHRSQITALTLLRDLFLRPFLFPS